MEPIVQRIHDNQYSEEKEDGSYQFIHWYDLIEALDDAFFFCVKKDELGQIVLGDGSDEDPFVIGITSKELSESCDSQLSSQPTRFPPTISF